jgi:hypothetical protein
MDDPNKILNPKTGRYVLKTGKIGKEILANIQSIKDNKPIQSIKDNKPIQSIKDNKPIQSIKDNKPIQSIKDNKPIQSIKDNKPIQSINKITINQLKTEWIEIFTNIIKTPITDTLLISIDQNNFLDIKLSKTEKIIGISGKGTLILRKLSDIALANRENTSIYLPKNYTGKMFAKPLWNVKHGYMYYKNDTNFKNLKILSIIINTLNKKYNNYILSNSPIIEQQTYGIIGIDIPFNEPEWLSKLIPGNKLSNPIVNKSGQFIFSKCAISTKTIELSTKFLNSKLDKFKNIYPKYLNIKNTNVISKDLNNFIDSHYIIALIAYNRHARIIFKNNNNLHIIDPWKQTADIGTKNLIKIIPNLTFIKRKAEQTNEGSCVAISYARSLYLSLTDYNSIFEPIPLEYIVLTSRLISKFRNKK